MPSCISATLSVSKLFICYLLLFSLLLLIIFFDVNFYITEVFSQDIKFLFKLFYPFILLFYDSLQCVEFLICVDEIFFIIRLISRACFSLLPFNFKDRV